MVLEPSELIILACAISERSDGFFPAGRNCARGGISEGSGTILERSEISLGEGNLTVWHKRAVKVLQKLGNSRKGVSMALATMHLCIAFMLHN